MAAAAGADAPSARPEGSDQKLLFTPGPLNTTMTVKEAMLKDYGSRDADFIQLTREIREGLLDVAGVGGADSAYTTVIVQGCGTMALEAVTTSIVPREGAPRVAVFSTGTYGRRLASMARIYDIDVVQFDRREGHCWSGAEVAAELAKDDDITHVFMVHCETSVGTTYPIQEIGDAIHSTPSKKHGARVFFLDSMAMFGAMEMNLADLHVDALVSSANKCIQGVPGFSFAILKKTLLTEVAAKMKPRTLSLDLHDQWKMLEASGQFRFTPATHSMLAFRQALRELEVETVAGRGKRYTALAIKLIAGMKELGFEVYSPEEQLPPKGQNNIITPFLQPKSDKFDFAQFSANLTKRGVCIYPGRVEGVPMFRVGHIGSLQLCDVDTFLKEVAAVKEEMGF